MRRQMKYLFTVALLIFSGCLRIRPEASNLDPFAEPVVDQQTSIVSHPATNALWLTHFVPATNAVSLLELRNEIERQSISSDPEGRGLRVVLPREPNPELTAPILLKGTDMTLLQLLKFCAQFTGSELHLADNVALLLGPVPYPYVIVAVDGTCVDAETGKGINHLKIKPEWPYDPIMYVNTNGFFACGIAKRFRSWPAAGALIQSDEEPRGAVVFTLSAPGYEPRVVTNCFMQDYCGWHGQTFKLKRKRDGEQDESTVPVKAAPSASSPVR